VSRVLITPRAPTRALGEFGQSASSVAGQRVGRVRRRRPARRIRWLRGLATVAATAATAAAIVGAGYWVLTTERFAGGGGGGARRLARAAPADPRGLRHRPRSEPLADRPRARASPAGGDAEIRRADVVRELPNRVAIVVEERRPVHARARRQAALAGRGRRVLGDETRAVNTDVR
jgi:hypothetical protein